MSALTRAALAVAMLLTLGPGLGGCTGSFRHGPADAEAPPPAPSPEQLGLLDRPPRPEQLGRRAPRPAATRSAPEDPPAEPMAAPARGDAAEVSVRREDEDAPAADDAGEAPPAEAPGAADAEPTPARSGGLPLLNRLTWTLASWSAPGSVETIIEQNRPAGLRFIPERGEERKYAFGADLGEALPPPAATGAAVQARAGGQALVSLACFVVVGEEGAYYESPAEALGSKPRRFIYRFHHPVWKSETTKWTHTAAVPAAEEVRRLGFVLYGGEPGEAVPLRRLEFIVETPDDE